MKTVVFIFCLFSASACFSQNASYISSEVSATHMSEHVEHATQHDLAEPRNILINSAYSYAQGERPLWEFGPVSQPVPLGDIAREYRKEHETAKKSEVSWEN